MEPDRPTTPQNPRVGTPGHGASPLRVLLAALATAALVFVAGLSAPERAQGGDTVAGRYGALVWSCRGAADLARVDWIAARVLRGRMPYFVQLDAGGGLVSTFGPGPAWLGVPSMASLRPGTMLDDDRVAARARAAASFAIATSAFLLCLAIASRAPLGFAVAGALTAAFSFAGAGTLGQGLWQQTASLPWLMAGVATCAFSTRAPRWGLATPALSAVALALRPSDVGLVLGLTLAHVGCLRSERRLLVRSFVLGALALLPFAAWNLEHFDTVWPVGQLRANERLTERVFVFSPEHVGAALAGLLASPARGLLLFAPITCVGVVLALRRGPEVRDAALSLGLGIGLLVQLLICATFYKWWGGLGFGPRLCAAMVWVACAIVAMDERVTDGLAGHGLRAWRGVVAAGSVVTLAVGLVALWGYDPAKWEARRDPDTHTDALWDVSDSPIVAALRRPRPAEPLRDAPFGPFRYCAPDSGFAVQSVRAAQPRP